MKKITCLLLFSLLAACSGKNDYRSAQAPIYEQAKNFAFAQCMHNAYKKLPPQYRYVNEMFEGEAAVFLNKSAIDTDTQSEIYKESASIGSNAITSAAIRTCMKWRDSRKLKNMIKQL